MKLKLERTKVMWAPEHLMNWLNYELCLMIMNFYYFTTCSFSLTFYRLHTSFYACTKSIPSSACRRWLLYRTLRLTSRSFTRL